MRVDLFEFDLPQERIALRPTAPREDARLLVVNSDALEDRKIYDLPSILKDGDVLVINDTKVINAQLSGHRPPRAASDKGAKVDVTLHRKVDTNTWRAFVRPAKRLRVGDHVDFGRELTATVSQCFEAGEVEFQFETQSDNLMDALHEVGQTPLPPYISSQRDVDARDVEDYQTVYAQHDGSVAAPTAGLHFSSEMIKVLEDKGVQVERVTLHVGAGTFLPVKTDDTSKHKMHAEWGHIGKATAERIQTAKSEGRRIISVGTTSLRLLESAANAQGVIEVFDGQTDIFITPGFRFKVVDVLITNFHLPRSTLFMLVCAFSGRERMVNAYEHAIKTGYGFYSYGDACLLFPGRAP